MHAFLQLILCSCILHNLWLYPVSTTLLQFVNFSYLNGFN